MAGPFNAEQREMLIRRGKAALQQNPDNGRLRSALETLELVRKEREALATQESRVSPASETVMKKSAATSGAQDTGPRLL